MDDCALDCDVRRRQRISAGEADLEVEWLLSFRSENKTRSCDVIVREVNSDVGIWILFDLRDVFEESTSQ